MQDRTLSRRSLLAALGAVGLGSLASRPAWAGQQAGKAAADFTLPDLSKVPTRLAELRGKVVVIDFWASWCDPCLKELPELEKLHKELSPKGVVFIGVNIDREARNASALVTRFGLTFKVLHDPEGKVAELYDPPKMPSSYVLDKAGVVRYLNEGFSGAADVARFRKQITELI